MTDARSSSRGGVARPSRGAFWGTVLGSSSWAMLITVLFAGLGDWEAVLVAGLPVALFSVSFGVMVCRVGLPGGCGDRARPGVFVAMLVLWLGVMLMLLNAVIAPRIDGIPALQRGLAAMSPAGSAGAGASGGVGSATGSSSGVSAPGQPRPGLWVYRTPEAVPACVMVVGAAAVMVLLARRAPGGTVAEATGAGRADGSPR